MPALRSLFILLNIFVLLGVFSACKQNSAYVQADKFHQNAPGTISMMVTPTQGGDFQVYVMNHRRGALEPTEQTYQLTEDQEFLAFGLDVIASNGIPMMRVQT